MIETASQIVAPLILLVLLYIDYFLIAHRIRGELRQRGFNAFSRVMQLGYMNRLLVFGFQVAIAINIDLNNDTTTLLFLLLFVPSFGILLMSSRDSKRLFHLNNARRILTIREIILIHLSYALFCGAWVMPLLVNLANDSLKSTAMTSVTLANGIAGFIIAFVQEPAMQRLSKSHADLEKFLEVTRWIRRNVSIGILVLTTACFFWVNL
ncbi:hypothetical protein [Boseongicola aestuarii]|uniref:Uncharacterized protein n=1 Tax=Boseongicola aestuarii TaxID=1470561 RepID=A0A238IYZ2_9RHOB|nr:hypothetical protein [Boseongicola aestuarii]SMX23627.1 hypothetical protein BOA8489_01737 [Boseongicola aestuarii]